MIRQPYTLVRFHVGSVGSKRRIRFLGSKAMILFTRRLMPAELRLRSDRETQKSEIYFTNHTLTGKPDAFPLLGLDLPGDSAGRLSVTLRSHGARHLYFTNHTLTGNKSLFAVTPEAANRCQLAIAAPSPNFFHQSHFDWEHESVRVSTRKPPTAANCPLHLRRQIFSPVTL